MGLSPVAVRFAAASSKEFLDIRATIECGFTLKRVRDMRRTYSQMHCTGKYSQHSWVIYDVFYFASQGIFQRILPMLLLLHQRIKKVQIFCDKKK